MSMKKSNLFTILMLFLIVVLAVSVFAGVAKNDAGDIIIPGGIGDGTGNSNDNNGDTGDAGNGNESDCTHSSTDVTVSNYGDQLFHRVTVKCLLCGETVTSTIVEHAKWNNSVCGGCGYKCLHIDSSYETCSLLDDTYHTVRSGCVVCEREVETQEQHVISGNRCTKCGYTKACTHTSGTIPTEVDYYNESIHIVLNNCVSCNELISITNEEHSCTSPSYTHVDNSSHIVAYSCDACKELYMSETKAHEVVNGVCTLCKNAVACLHPTTYKEAWSVDSAQHFEVLCCSVCHLSVSSSEYKNHTFVDGVCSVCKYECEHSFADGICTICLFACDHSDKDFLRYRISTENKLQHEEFYICNKCDNFVGIWSDHNFNEVGVCTLCEYEHEHNFDEGAACSLCDYVCDHSGTKLKGMCVTCYADETPCSCSRDDGIPLVDLGYAWDAQYCYKLLGCTNDENVLDYEVIGEHIYGDDGKCTTCGYLPNAEG